MLAKNIPSQMNFIEKDSLVNLPKEAAFTIIYNVMTRAVTYFGLYPARDESIYSAVTGMILKKYGYVTEKDLRVSIYMTTGQERYLNRSDTLTTYPTLEKLNMKLDLYTMSKILYHYQEWMVYKWRKENVAAPVRINKPVSGAVNYSAERIQWMIEDAKNYSVDELRIRIPLMKLLDIVFDYQEATSNVYEEQAHDHQLTKYKVDSIGYNRDRRTELERKYLNPNLIKLKARAIYYAAQLAAHDDITELVYRATQRIQEKAPQELAKETF